MPGQSENSEELYWFCGKEDKNKLKKEANQLKVRLEKLFGKHLIKVKVD